MSVHLSGSGGEDQLAALGQPQAILAPVVLYEQLPSLSEQSLANDPTAGWRQTLTLLIFRRVFL